MYFCAIRECDAPGIGYLTLWRRLRR